MEPFRSNYLRVHLANMHKISRDKAKMLTDKFKAIRPDAEGGFWGRSLAGPLPLLGVQL